MYLFNYIIIYNWVVLFEKEDYMEMRLKKDDYSNLSITELMTLLKKASSDDERKFFFNLVNEARHIAAKKVVK